MKIPEAGIAFFDSGIGGLTVLDACQKHLKGENLYYYGDNDRAPYGNLSKAQIRAYVFEVFEYFAKLNVKAAVLACNTATAVCADELRARYPFPIVGAEPAIFLAAKTEGEVLILSTRATYESERFRILCKRAERFFPKACLRPVACDALAGEIERHLTDAEFDFTKFLPRASPAAVVLGCTHYVYIKNVIARFYGCEVYDGNEGIANRLRGLLAKNEYAKQPADRDERPLCWDGQPPGGEFAPDALSFYEKKKEAVFFETTKMNRIFFLGSQKIRNKTIFEQMFVNLRK